MQRFVHADKPSRNRVPDGNTHWVSKLVPFAQPYGNTELTATHKHTHTHTHARLAIDGNHRYCTVQCAEVIDEIESLYSGSKDPTCDEFPVINAVLQRETSFARRKCKTPVSVRAVVVLPATCCAGYSS